MCVLRSTILSYSTVLFPGGSIVHDSTSWETDNTAFAEVSVHSSLVSPGIGLGMGCFLNGLLHPVRCSSQQPELLILPGSPSLGYIWPCVQPIWRMQEVQARSTGLATSPISFCSTATGAFTGSPDPSMARPLAEAL